MHIIVYQYTEIVVSSLGNCQTQHDYMLNFETRQGKKNSTRRSGQLKIMMKA